MLVLQGNSIDEENELSLVSMTIVNNVISRALLCATLISYKGGGGGEEIFDTTVKLIHWPAIHLSLEEVAVRAGHKVLVEVDFDSVLIVGDPWQIMGQIAQALQNLLSKYRFIIFPKS